ncbi:MAG: universal stress protein [Deltaproteobacteria bacterium]|nr:universal stress protein [Deltaproteobacteria bacterium]
MGANSANPSAGAAAPTGMWRTLLVPHDFSSCADHALELAVGLAKTHAAEIVLAHVSSLGPNVPADAFLTPPGEASAVRLADYVAKDARARLDAVASRARELGAPSVRAVAVVSTRTGIVEELLQLAREVRADVFVAGTHGRTGLSHVLVGSVTERLVRLSPIPVVTLRSKGPDAAPTLGESVADDEATG